MAGRGIIDEAYVNRMTPEQLRRELIDELEFTFGLMAALRDLPEMPPPFILHRLDEGATWEHHSLGKQLQRTHSIDVIPPVSECEGGAGLWSIIRAALVAAKPAQ